MNFDSDEISRKLMKFHQYWEKRHQNGRCPMRSEIDPFIFPDLLPWMCILDVDIQNEAVVDAHFRLAGTALYEMAGSRELTGKPISEILPSSEYEFVIGQMNTILKDHVPMYRKVTRVLPQEEEVVYERLLFPLLDTNTGHVAQLIGVHDVVTGSKRIREVGFDLA